MTTQTTPFLLNAVYTSTREGEAILKRLTQAAGFAADNVMSRLAISRSLAEPTSFWDPSWEADSDGKQIKGFTLLGRQEIAAALLGMIAVAEGRRISARELRRLVRLHWERGLRLMAREIQQDDAASMLVDYAHRSILGEALSVTPNAVLSPARALGSVVVGQAIFKKKLEKVLEDACAADPPRLGRPLSLIGPDGSGRGTIARAAASSLQLPFVSLGRDDLKSSEQTLWRIEEQLATQGYARVSDSDERAEYPAAIILVRDAAALRANELALVLTLHPSRSFASFGNLKIRVDGGGLVLSSKESWPSRKVQFLELSSYTRDEVAEILRREVGGWPLELRRYLALAGRLNPRLAVTRAKEFLSEVRAKGKDRPSEGLLLETMYERWGMDRLGLIETDYEVLEMLQGGPQHIDEKEPGSVPFLERLGMVRLRGSTSHLTERGLEALRIRGEETNEKRGDR